MALSHEAQRAALARVASGLRIPGVSVTAGAPPSTLDMLRASVVSSEEKEMERDPIPAAILAMCEQRQGRPLTKRDAKALEEEFPGLVTWLEKCSRGTRICYWARVSKAWNGNLRKGEVKTWDGSPDALALVAKGAPAGYENQRWITVSNETTSARWMTPAELRERNARSYDAADERNATRRATIAAVRDERTESTIRTVARLMDEIAFMYDELEANLEQLPAPIADAARVMLDVRRVASIRTRKGEE